MLVALYSETKLHIISKDERRIYRDGSVIITHKKKLNAYQALIETADSTRQ